MVDPASEGKDVAREPLEDFVERLRPGRRRPVESQLHLLGRRPPKRRPLLLEQEIDDAVAKLAHLLTVERERVVLRFPHGSGILWARSSEDEAS